MVSWSSPGAAAFLSLQQPPVPEQRVGPRLPPAKGYVQLRRIPGVAGLVDRSQAGGERGIERVAGFPEGVEPIGVEDLGPEVSVVAGCVAAAREQVLEVRRPVPEPDRTGHPDLLEEGALERRRLHRCGLRVRVEGE